VQHDVVDADNATINAIESTLEPNLRRCPLSEVRPSITTLCSSHSLADNSTSSLPWRDITSITLTPPQLKKPQQPTPITAKQADWAKSQSAT